MFQVFAKQNMRKTKPASCASDEANHVSNFDKLFVIIQFTV